MLQIYYLLNVRKYERAETHWRKHTHTKQNEKLKNLMRLTLNLKNITLKGNKLPCLKFSMHVTYNKLFK